jgi:hypothetical protein
MAKSNSELALPWTVALALGSFVYYTGFQVSSFRNELEAVRTDLNRAAYSRITRIEVESWRNELAKDNPAITVPNLPPNLVP